MKKLTNLRTQANLSSEELANALNEIQKSKKYSKETISRLENGQTALDANDILNYSIHFGISADELISEMNDAPAYIFRNVKDNCSKINIMKKEMSNVIYKYNQISKGEHYSDNTIIDIDTVSNFGKLCDNICRKLRIAFIGKPDSGKSTLINKIIGHDVLPKGWTPKTSTVIILKHIRDKNEGTDENINVLVYKINNKTKFDINKINDEKYNNYIYDKGSYELLEKYGAHNDESDALEIDAIVVYIDSNVLLNVDLIDLPGYRPKSNGNDTEITDIFDSRDTMLSAEAIETADSYVYISPANSFIYGEDISILGSMIKHLPIIENKEENTIKPFGNIFILSSQASILGGSDNISLIHERAANNLWDYLGNHISIKNREKITGYKYTADTLKNRFYATEINSAGIMKRFFDDFSNYIEEISELQNKIISNKLNEFVNKHSSDLVIEKKKMQNLINNHEENKKYLETLKEEEKERNVKFNKNVRQVEDAISDFKKKSEDDITKFYNSIINKEHINSIIEENGFKKNKKDFEKLSLLINSELENGITEICSKLTKEFKSNIDHFVINIDSKSLSLVTSFNTANAFISGLTGIAAYGALAAWASTCGNLGGYILVAKAVSVLSAIGIHLGGTATVISAVSAIGGPLTIGITIAVLATIGSLLAFGGTWKKVIGNRIVKEYNKKGILKKILDNIDKYWNETRDAFRQGADEVERQWKVKYNEFKNDVENFDIDNINSRIYQYDTAIEFIDSIKNILEKY
ncbi:MAG: dynamin family protein [Acetobacter sp.]|nr:dynamin family protein [Bacteroides sp.]MCM1341324.1 dynamin family protein [Acetobacter sp.]MCM1433900.1 dynamin family protein [Clostridiales bacterium]